MAMEDEIEASRRQRQELSDRKGAELRELDEAKQRFLNEDVREAATVLSKSGAPRLMVVQWAEWAHVTNKRRQVETSRSARAVEAIGQGWDVGIGVIVGGRLLRGGLRIAHSKHLDTFTPPTLSWQQMRRLGLRTGHSFLSADGRVDPLEGAVLKWAGSERRLAFEIGWGATEGARLALTRGVEAAMSA